MGLHFYPFSGYLRAGDPRNICNYVRGSECIKYCWGILHSVCCNFWNSWKLGINMRSQRQQARDESYIPVKKNCLMDVFFKILFLREILIMLSIFDTIFVISATISFSLPILSELWKVIIFGNFCIRYSNGKWRTQKVKQTECSTAL